MYNTGCVVASIQWCVGIFKKELRCVDNFKYLRKKPVEG